MMTKNWIFAGVLAAAAFTSVAAEAQYRRYGPASPPSDLWCREINDWGGNHRICSAFTFEQCMASRYSHTETCYLNPLYDSRFRQRR
jgi:hypothetical protein